MALIFYPSSDDAQKGTLEERIEILQNAAENYKAAILEMAVKPEGNFEQEKKLMTPREQKAAYNWEEVARILRQVRETSEGTKIDKLRKAELFTKLAEVYEILRGAKMPKLEAVRLALISEANQLRGSSTQIP